MYVDSESPLWGLKFDGLRSRPGSGPSRPFTGMSRDTLRRVSSLLFICKFGFFWFPPLCVCVALLCSVFQFLLHISLDEGELEHA